jgi:HJR/Mrr/RecB family endonuclease
MTSFITKVLIRFWPRILMAWGLVSVLDVSITRSLAYFGVKPLHDHHRIAEMTIPLFAFIIPFIWRKVVRPLMLLSLVSCLGAAVVLFALHYVKIKVPQSNEFFAGLLASVACLILVVKLSFARKKAFVSLTMKQIDAFGNGNTYDAGHMFEEYIVSVYRRLGYSTAISTTEMRHKGLLPADIQKRGGSGEQGVDVVIDLEEKNSNGQPQRVIIQCKHYSGNVPNSAIQEIHAAMNLYRADYAAVITNSYFTAPAAELAKSNNVMLIDRDGLANLIARSGSSSGDPTMWSRIEQTMPVAKSGAAH